MLEEQMGSQTLEILRQGVWASLTGGWFYDPHQDVFCNTFHLYIWLFLLCLPFTIYVYFPPTRFLWYVYCGSVAIVLTLIKLINYGLHHMYDTTECVQEKVEDDWQGTKKEDEGIELQILSKKSGETTRPPARSLPTSYTESAALQSTDADSIESNEFSQTDLTEIKPNTSRIDLKAEVHRKNSSESSDDVIPTIEIIPQATEPRKAKKSERRTKHQRSKTDGFVITGVAHPPVQPQSSNSFWKLCPQEPTDFSLLRPALDCEAGTSGLIETAGRRHSNFTNSSLNFLPTNVQPEIKPTGSLELAYIDKNPNQALTSEGFYFEAKPRRIRSTALETCCPPPSLTAHPNSLEIIGCKSTRNPLPPPSTSLRRNQHLNLCPYFGSEIVYPIAEQSDEHQTSHGPDTDLDSLTHISDSDFDEMSHSPLIYIKLKKVPARTHVPYGERKSKVVADEERTSATSKDALLENDNSNSSATPEMHDARADCYCTDAELSDKKLSECSCSNTSVECDERTEQFQRKSRGKRGASVDSGGGRMWQGRGGSVDSENFHCNEGNEAAAIVRKRNVRKNKKRKLSCDVNKNGEAENCSSLDELEWLFDDGLKHRKEPLKRETEWSSTTTVSLEHDVSKVLQETVPSSARSLGAIPKKNRSLSSQNDHQSDRKTPKSESDKCSMCRCKSDVAHSALADKSHHIKENQKLRHSNSTSPVEGATYVVARKLHRVNVPVKAAANRQAPSTSTNTELSTLLPPARDPLLAALLDMRCDVDITDPSVQACMKLEVPLHHRNRLKRCRVNRRRSNQLVKRDSAIASSISAGYGTHSAKSFSDTSDGAIHCFVDEQGNWMTYSFDEKGIGTVNSRVATDEKAVATVAPKSELWDLLNSNDSICHTEGAAKTRIHPSQNCANMHAVQVARLRRSLPEHMRFIRRRLQRDQTGVPPNNPDDSLISIVRESETEENRNHRFKFIQASDNNNYTRTKSYYKFKVLPWTFFKVTLDRLKLLALLDRNLTVSETVVSIVLGVLVSVLGAFLLYLDFYKDFLAFILCFIIASCQYSLLKSVQPDAASPTHGFNRVIAYSRPIYFCLIGAIVVILHANLTPATIELDYNFQRYSDSQTLILLSRDFFIKFILFFPILFSLGLFPQINTFLMYLLEQIDMHLFGGNAMSSLLASFYCIFRSVLAVLVMDGLVYGALIEPKSSQHILFSLFSACLVASSYHLSRSASDPSHVWNILKRHLWPPDIYREHASNFEAKVDIESEEAKVKEKSVSFPPDVKEASEPSDEHVDPLPNKLRKTVNGRLQNDVILCSLIAILVFGIHASTVFTVLQPELSPVLWSIAASLGLILHYIIPQLRKQLPWLCIARPIFRSYEHEQYQIRGPAKIMWFERVYVYFCFLERSILYPLLFLSAMTEDAPKIAEKYGPLSGSFMVVICGLKCLRSSYSDQTSQYLILTFTALFIKYDYSFMEETFLVQYFFMSLAFHKFYELLLKVQFVVTYIAPWQITWGSAFHAFAQPFSVPHSAMLFLQAFISAALSTPLNPFLGSAIFLTSYVRPVKFWERDYNTRRVDHSNTPLSSHLDRNLGADDNNLNSIFYEHLTRSLQHSLCGDLAMGRWGPVNQGDCFVLASDYLNCLVHIIEMGNGLVTFQMRGLEFRGTYCQQREVEAITEGVEENDGCCCCNTGHLPNMLSVNAAFSQRWLAWEVTAAKYILEGYSISDNSAVSMLQVFEFRKVLVSYYVKSIIFYTIRSPKLDEWLASQSIQKALQPMAQRNFVDLDPVFNGNINEDFDVQFCGMTRNMFEQVYGDWISYCVERNEKSIDTGVHSNLVLLCFALSLLGRRTLGAVSHNVVSNVEFFLYGLHALFKGDFRITCARDEWVFSDMDLLKTVVAPGVRMSLKLHQDHFMSPDEYEDQPALYDAICKHEEELVISHEGDPAWRSAVLSGTASLLALRHVVDDGVDEYKIIMLNKRYLSFRVIKINKECVRGLWAGQQQELVYLRNRNPERGSIQNAKQALRNIINSSCDQPIGYPIYVSPLTTSYAETNEQYRGLVGGSVSLKKIRNYVFNLFRRIRKRCGEGCSSGASNREEIGMGHEGVYAMTPITTLTHQTTGSQSIDGSHLGGSIGRGSSLSRTSLGGNRGSLVSMGKPTSSTLASLAGLFKEKDERAVSQVPDAQTRADERLGDVNDTSTDKDCIYNSRIVRISDPNVVYDAINLGRRIDVIWPTEYMRIRGGRSNWKDWIPEVGMEGPVVHKWTPSNKDANKRSHVDRTILLVQIDERFVPIAESGVQDLGQDG